MIAAILVLGIITIFAMLTNLWLLWLLLRAKGVIKPVETTVARKDKPAQMYGGAPFGTPRKQVE
jgi:hypothetical protein